MILTIIVVLILAIPGDGEALTFNEENSKNLVTYDQMQAEFKSMQEMLDGNKTIEDEAVLA